MSSEKKKPDSEFDIFIANSVYPDVAPIFTYSPKSLDTIKDDCFIVIDTNALLVPYSIGKESLEQIQITYEKLVGEKRLLIPAQVVREFARNRANKLTELFQQLNRKRNNSQGLQKGKYPLLESLPEYQESVRLEGEIDKLLHQYRESLGKVLDHVRNWAWNDPVSILYSKLFTQDVVFDYNLEKPFIQDDLNRRQLHNLPPGYKDAGKQDEGIGDLLIWHTILEIGRTHKKSVIFVSGDEKADWWHRSESQALYPRYELVDEFRRNSEGQSFHIIAFSRLLNLYGASDKVVQEVRKEEVFTRGDEIRSAQAIRSSFDELIRKEVVAVLAIQSWLKTTYAINEIYVGTDQLRFLLKDSRVPADIAFVDDSQNITAVEVMFMDIDRVQSPTLRMRLRDRSLSGYYAVSEGKISTYMIVVVGDSEETVIEAATKLDRSSSRIAKVSYILGYLDQDGEFQKVFSETD
ncbi:MAG: PIN domain-containing protein [Aulosira sp. ZfuCHP01]|nr:PIN domain-containing protein [Aulosira sp. ZfuVER01]MDZ7996981.1 PIN domain-containing protein [Aulosira sp. DedVER01a]MDZ8053010.1 PIN domain-containing protein [Aulosira sp. ZfuCHP01]